jgi:Uma2 family endonuclease
MSTLAVPPFLPPIDYPDSDGMPMAENTLQYEWIVTIVTGLRHLFDGNPNVFVAGDLFWYPVERHPEIRMAPDAMVAIGRPPGHRGSYRQWEEAGIAPQVVFEVLSPGNRAGEMKGKLDFYARYGVEEYYIYDPDRLVLTGYLRKADRLIEISQMPGHVSARLGIKFIMGQDGLTLLRPDGEPFLPAEEIARRQDQERQRADREHDRAETAIDHAKQADERAEQERERADRLQRELDRLRR